MATSRRACALAAAVALPLAAFIRTERSPGTPLVAANSHAIEYRIHAGTLPGLRSSSGEETITADSTPTAALLAAFETWSRIEGSHIQFASPVPEPDGAARTDGVNLVTFADTPGNRSITAGAIAVTRLFSDPDGTLLDTDVIFNPEMPFSTTLEEGTFDIQGALTHELGHALGMDHSGSATATMFATTTRGSKRLRSLTADDRAFAQEVYPGEVPREFGAIEGVVGSPAGGFVIGAIVTAYAEDANLVVSAITGFDGRFRIPQLPPGDYRLIVEPLDGPAQVFHLSFLRRGANTRFRTLHSDSPIPVLVNETAQASLTIEPGDPVYNLIGLGASQPGEEPATRAGAVVERGSVYEIALHGEGLDDPAIELESLQVLGSGVEILPTPLERDRVGFEGGEDFPSLHFTIRVAADAPLGVASLLLATPAGLAASTAGFEVVEAEAPPDLNREGVVNAATFLGGPVAPGSLLSLFGRRLAPTAAGAFVDPVTGRLGDLLAGVAVRLNGKPAPLLFVSPGQINLQAPVDLRIGQAIVSIDRDGMVSPPVNLDVVASAPGLFGAPGGAALAVLADGSLNSPATPVRRGDFLTLYGVGAGAVSPALRSGELAPASPLSLVDGSVEVLVGGQSAAVTFAGMTPGFAGLLQINIRVPEDAPAGDAVPLLVRIAGAAAPLRSIAVQ